MSNSMTAKFVLRVVDNASSGIRSATNSFRALSKARQRASKAFAAAANLRLAEQNVSRYATMARNAVAAPINAAADFEKAMSDVKAVTEMGTKTFVDMRAEAKRLGATTMFTAVEAAKGMEMLGMAGFKSNEIISAMPATLALTAAAGEELGTVADIASNIMGGFNIKATEMESVSDILAQTFTSSNSTLATLGETMKMVAPQASTLGISLEETAAMAGLLASSGIKGTMAGTALTAMMVRLAAPTKEGARALKTLSITTKDAHGDLLKIPDILAQISASTKGMGNTTKTAFMKQIFGIRASKAAMKLLDKTTTKGIIAYTEKIKKADSLNVALKIQKTKTDNLRGSIKLLESANDGLMTSIGDGLLPELRKYSSQATEILQSLNKWTKVHPILTGYIFKTAVAIAGLLTILTITLGMLSIVASGLGVLAIAFGSSATGAQLLGGGLRGVVRGLVWVSRTIFTKAVPAFEALTTASAATLGVIAGAVAALAYAGYLVGKNWEGIKGWFSELNTQIDATLDKLGLFGKLLSADKWIADKTFGAFARFTGSNMQSVVSMLGFETDQKTAGTAKTAGAVGGKPQDAQGQLDINITSDGRAEVTNSSSSGFLSSINPNVGLAGSF